MNTKHYSLFFTQLQRLFDLSVWSNKGKMYCPLFGYNNEVVAYTHAPDALATLNKVHFGDAA